MEWLSPKGFEWDESDRVGEDCEVGSRLIVAFEFPYTLTTDSLGTGLAVGGMTTIFSVGSGRLRTVSAGAGMSLASCAEGWRAAAFRRRHQRKRPTERTKNAMEPTTAPATTPALTPWPELGEADWS